MSFRRAQVSEGRTHANGQHERVLAKTSQRQLKSSSPHFTPSLRRCCPQRLLGRDFSKKDLGGTAERRGWGQGGLEKARRCGGASSSLKNTWRLLDNVSARRPKRRPADLETEATGEESNFVHLRGKQRDRTRRTAVCRFQATLSLPPRDVQQPQQALQA